jgi:hypothetical protein
MERFRLAPMTADLRAMTAVVLALPVVFLVISFAAAAPAGPILGGVAILMLILYASVWLFFRPSGFEIIPGTLEISWPLRRMRVEGSEIETVENVTRSEFRERYGWGMRVGAGGLWGGFGLLKTGKGYLTMYISRTDAFVLITRRSPARPMMLTPERPEQFVESLRRAVQ